MKCERYLIPYTRLNKHFIFDKYFLKFNLSYIYFPNWQDKNNQTVWFKIKVGFIWTLKLCPTMSKRLKKFKTKLYNFTNLVQMSTRYCFFTMSHIIFTKEQRLRLILRVFIVGYKNKVTSHQILFLVCKAMVFCIVRFSLGIISLLKKNMQNWDHMTFEYNISADN